MGGLGPSHRLWSLAVRSARQAGTRSLRQKVCSPSIHVQAHARSLDARSSAAQGILSRDFGIFRSSYSDVFKGSSLAQWDTLRRFSANANEDSVSVIVPSMGESVNDGNIAAFLKQPGDAVNADDIIAQIETDKVTIDVRTPEAGVLQSMEVKEGDTVTPGTVIAIITKGAAPPPPPPAAEKPKEAAAAPKSPPPPPPPSPKPAVAAPPLPSQGTKEGQLPPKDLERRVPMTRLRKRVATRLKDAQNTFALLTTFNEVDMTNLMQLRSDFKDEFVEKHGVKLGFMSAFVKAAVVALQQNPVVNAVIDGDDIIYRDYYDISIAVGTPKGLVVPVIRRAETLGFSQIEQTINMLGKKARDGALAIDDMAGGTFTISNGGVYGSLLSTPIVNPPQSAILGMHSIVQRPMVVGKEILARPMMYLALTYDHRLIDGREAVLFLRRIKAGIEDPRRLILDL